MSKSDVRFITNLVKALQNPQGLSPKKFRRYARRVSLRAMKSPITRDDAHAVRLIANSALQRRGARVV